MLSVNTYNNHSNNETYPMHGEIWRVDLTEAIGCQQGGIRPALIYSNNTYNKFSPTIMVIPITSKIFKKSPVHVLLHHNNFNGLTQDSVIEVEKMRDINKFQLKEKIGTISEIDDIKVASKFLIMYPSLCNVNKSEYNLIRA